jgi:3-isopropylmalate/(R)-2-methylmalate dehydratase small subunit
MESNRITKVAGTGIAVRGNDIDTDRIIPARYLKEVTFDHMGEYPFIDERFDESGNARQHPFNDPQYQNASVLFANANFGCGSSREHAPQALHRWGINAIVGESFAEIFAGNSLVIGLPLVTAKPEDIQRAMDMVEEDPTTPVTVDIEGKSLKVGDTTFPITMPETIRSALVQGHWDSTAVLAANMSKVRETAAKLPYVSGFKS